MSESVSVHAAKTHLSRPIRKAQAGESIVITTSGEPVARLVALASEPRRPGALKGKIRITRDFEAPLPDELLRRFRGESERGRGSTRTSCSGGCATTGGCRRRSEPRSPSRRTRCW